MGSGSVFVTPIVHFARARDGHAGNKNSFFTTLELTISEAMELGATNWLFEFQCISVGDIQAIEFPNSNGQSNTLHLEADIGEHHEEHKAAGLDTDYYDPDIRRQVGGLSINLPQRQIPALFERLNSVQIITKAGSAATQTKPRIFFTSRDYADALTMVGAAPPNTATIVLFTDVAADLGPQNLRINTYQPKALPNSNCCWSCGRDPSESPSDAGGSLLNCAACRIAKYCDKTCQRADWKIHKLKCKTFKRCAAAFGGQSQEEPEDNPMRILDKMIGFEDYGPKTIAQFEKRIWATKERKELADDKAE